jgi:hypothetical protein
MAVVMAGIFLRTMRRRKARIGVKLGFLENIGKTP